MIINDFIDIYLNNLKKIGQKELDEHKLVLSHVDLQEFNEDIILGTLDYQRLYKGDKNIDGWRDILEDFRHQFKIVENNAYVLL